MFRYDDDLKCKLIRGSELPKTPFYRIMNPDLVHFGFQWKLGENTDILPFNRAGLCEPGGLYFTTLEKLLDYFTLDSDVWTLLDHWLAQVTVDDDEEVWSEDNQKWKAHRVTVLHMTKFENVPELVRLSMAVGYQLEHQPEREVMDQMWLEASKYRSGCLALLPAELQTDELVKEVVAFRKRAFRYVANQHFDLCCYAVTMSKKVLNYIRDDDMRERVEQWLLDNKDSS